MSATARPNVELGAMWTTTLPAWMLTPALMGSLIGAVDAKCLIAKHDVVSKIVLMGFKNKTKAESIFEVDLRGLQPLCKTWSPWSVGSRFHRHFRFPEYTYS